LIDFWPWLQNWKVSFTVTNSVHTADATKFGCHLCITLFLDTQAVLTLKGTFGQVL